jgi:uncharacterized protein (TIGR02996 family)
VTPLSPHDPDHDALLAAAHGADDTPRLLLADWLDDHGEAERAELLRVASLPDLAWRERELRRRLEESWLRPLAGPDAEWCWERGLPARVALPIRAFLPAPEELLATGVREVRLFAPHDQCGRGAVAALATCPWLARVNSLDLQGHYLGVEAVATLAASPFLTGLRELHLGDDVLGLEGVEALALCRALSKLEVLSLGGNLIGDEGVRVLAGAVLPSLRALDLSHNSITDAGVLCLAVVPLSGWLEALDLSHNALSDTGVRVLDRSPYLRRVALDLHGNFLGARGALALTLREGRGGCCTGA